MGAQPMTTKFLHDLQHLYFAFSQSHLPNAAYVESAKAKWSAGTLFHSRLLEGQLTQLIGTPISFQHVTINWHASILQELLTKDSPFTHLLPARRSALAAALLLQAFCRTAEDSILTR